MPKEKKNTTILNLWLIMLQLPVAAAAAAAAAAVAKSLQSPKYPAHIVCWEESPHSMAGDDRHADPQAQ